MTGIIIRIEQKFMIIKTPDVVLERVKVQSDIHVGERIAYKRRNIYRGTKHTNYKD